VTALAIVEAVFVCTGSSYMALALPLMGFAIYWIQKYYLRTSRQLRILELEAISPLIRHVTETAEGLSTIRAFGWQTTFQDNAINHVDDSQRPYYLLLCLQRWLTLVLGLLVAAVGTLVVALAMLIPSSSSGGYIGLALTSVLNFTGALGGILEQWTSAEMQVGAVTRTRSFEKTTPSEYVDDAESEPDADWPSGDVKALDLKVAFQ
jgi:ABC-type multidrug transport system fused ATPase/permease subunit